MRNAVINRARFAQCNDNGIPVTALVWGKATRHISLVRCLRVWIHYKCKVHVRAYGTIAMMWIVTRPICLIRHGFQALEWVLGRQKKLKLGVWLLVEKKKLLTNAKETPAWKEGRKEGLLLLTWTCWLDLLTWHCFSAWTRHMPVLRPTYRPRFRAKHHLHIQTTATQPSPTYLSIRTKLSPPSKRTNVRNTMVLKLISPSLSSYMHDLGGWSAGLKKRDIYTPWCPRPPP
jgi:hypothetical protein